MRLRFYLLAGAVLPFALNFPAIALDRSSPRLLQLAQNDAQPCPEGQECPPPEQQPPAAEQPPAEQPPAEQPPAETAPAEQPPAAQAPAEEPPAQAPAEEAPAAEPPAQEQPAAEPPPAEQPPAEQPPAAEPVPEQQPTEQAPEEPPAPELPGPEETQQAPPQPEQPAAEQAQPQQTTTEQPAVEPAAPEQPAEQNAHRRQRQQQQEGTGQQQPDAQQPAQQEAAQPPAAATPPAPQESTVEQQLEAQGDTEEAKKVRSLRDQLLEQLQQAIGVQPQQQQPQQQEQTNNNRRDRNRPGNRDQQGQQDTSGGDNGWWNRGQDRGDVVEQRGGRIIIDLGGGNVYVESVVPDEGDRLLYGADNVEVQDLPHGRTRTILHRPNGVDIVTIRDRNGNIIKRSRFLADGREIVLIDNRYPDNGAAPPPPILHNVPPPRVRIPRDRYVVDLGRASDADIRGALLAPLVQPIARPYTLDEVLRNEQVRAYSPRIDLDTITFDFGSATISDSQMGALYELGQVMEEVIAENPDEVYLIEGHTDAVGSDYDNLILSDQRAEAVATALSQNFDIPPENLVTEGYGEQFLKIDTQGPERRNRRATVRRVTELLQAENH